MSSPRRAAAGWLASGERFIGAACYGPRSGEPSPTAVVIVPGIAHEERTMSGGVTALAEALADDGFAALVIELHGTSQSGGTLNDDDIGARWREDIRSATAAMRAAGFADVVVVGIRLGALLMLDALRDEPTRALVAWAPIVSGRRYVRELKVMQASTHEAASADDGVAVAGFDIPRGVLDHLATLDPAGIKGLRTERLLLVDSAGLVAETWPERAAGPGVAIERVEAVDTDAWLFSPTDQPGVPQTDIAAIRQWCRRLGQTRRAAAANGPRRLALLTTVAHVHQGIAIRETSVEIGPIGLGAVMTGPADASPAPSAARLLVSTVGPGRTFVDFARDEAARGHVSLRFDFAGFGTSPCRSEGATGGELYTDDGRADVIDAMAHLRASGHRHVVVLGFCAGAWSVLQAGPLPGTAGIAAINIAMYKRRSATVVDGPAQRRSRWLHRPEELKVLKLLKRRLERASRGRSEPLAWLEAICDANVAVMLGYAQGDLGLAYLNRQLDRGGLATHLGEGRLELKVYDNLGHLIEGPAARKLMFAEVAEFFTATDRRLAAAA